jgi:2-polyprenyl-3-methyl-5-hydroxy-6-metoxy-1,4-benzoquinol methylase
LGHQELKTALRDLSRLNKLSGSSAILWNEIKQHCESRNMQEVRVLDVATGSGDVLIDLHRLASSSGIKLRVLGCDINPFTVEAAANRALANGIKDAEFWCADAITQRLEKRVDVVTVSLFTHHLREDEVVSLIDNVSNNTDPLLINDLARSTLNLALVTIATRLVSMSRVVHFDGPASVRNAFTPAELDDLARQAGLENFSIKNKFPCRMLLKWSRYDSRA